MAAVIFFLVLLVCLLYVYDPRVTNKGTGSAKIVTTVSPSPKPPISAGGGFQWSPIAAPATIQVYSDVAMQNPITSLSWGTLSPGQNETEILYLYSDVSFSSITANMTDPSPADFGHYSYLITNVVPLPAGQATPFPLTLVIDQNITGITNFSFQITLTGVES